MCFCFGYKVNTTFSILSSVSELFFIGGVAGGFRASTVFLSEEQLSTSHKPQPSGKRTQCKGKCKFHTFSFLFYIYKMCCECCFMLILQCSCISLDFKVTLRNPIRSYT